MEAFCPRCMSPQNLVESISDKAAKSKKDKETSPRKNFHCEKCGIFIKSESVSNA